VPGNKEFTECKQCGKKQNLLMELPLDAHLKVHNIYPLKRGNSNSPEPPTIKELFANS
jgi:hypothetical protein